MLGYGTARHLCHLYRGGVCTLGYHKSPVHRGCRKRWLAQKHNSEQTLRSPLRQMFLIQSSQMAEAPCHLA